MAKISTRKRGQSWEYSFEATKYTLDGSRKRIGKGGFATKQEAEEAGIQAAASLARGNVALISEKCTVGDFLSEWLESKKAELRLKTESNYRAYLHIIADHIGEKELRNLRPRHVHALMMELAKRGYAKNTLAPILNVLKEALSYAVFPMEVLQSNPAQGIKVPKTAPAKVVERHIIRPDKLNEILTAYPFGHRFHIPILLAYHTGMRIGEILGLAWDCVDLKKGSITVSRQLQYIAGKGTRFCLPKTECSIRTIPISDALVNVLRKWKAQQVTNEMRHGKAYLYTYEAKDGGLWCISKDVAPEKGMARRTLICTDEKGRHIPRISVMKMLKDHGVNSHSFRHTHATICAENGAPSKGIAERLGHSNTTITENLYTHGTEKMQRETLVAFLAKVD